MRPPRASIAPVRANGLFRNGVPQRIAVFRALQLGDMLCAVPALRALRQAAPHAHITLIGLPWARAFVERFHHYVDELLVFPGMPGMAEQVPDPTALPAFIEEARKRCFDLAIQLHGSGVLTNPLVRQFGARHTAGFYPPAQSGVAPENYLPWDEREHEVLRMLRLIEMLGVPVRSAALEFPLTIDDFAALAHSIADVPATGSYVCVHPGARMPSRRWPAERFAQIADRLAAQGWPVLLTGSADETDLVRRVRQAMRFPANDLAGKTSLGALAALVSRARMIVSNDTGLSHVAAAVGTPSVVICNGADPGRWAPLDAQRHRVLAHPVACRPCMHQHCPIAHPCAQGIGVETVWQQVQQLLQPMRWPAAGADDFPYRSVAS